MSSAIRSIFEKFLVDNFPRKIFGGLSNLDSDSKGAYRSLSSRKRSTRLKMMIFIRNSKNVKTKKQLF